MKHLLRTFGLLTCGLLPLTAAAQTADTTFVHFTDGAMHAIPDALVEEQTEAHDSLIFRLKDGGRMGYPLERVSRITATAPEHAVRFATFKFNNKYNDQLPADVEADIDPRGNVTATVGAIGKRLSPSFTTQPRGAEAFVDSVQQFSKRSRLRFAAPVTYTLCQPGYRVLTHTKIQDEVWSRPVEEVDEAPFTLTEAMLSTNAPSNYPATEGLGSLVDNNPQTYFHSTWGSGANEKLPLEEHPYIQIDLGSELQQFRFAYTTRPDNDARMPLAFRIQTSTDGRTWSDLRTLTADEDGLPVSGRGATYASPVMKADAPFRYLRLTMTESNYKNYLCLAELSISRVTSVTVSDPELISPARYAYALRPYGSQATVDVTWLTDAATNVPRIDIMVDGGRPIVDKETYLDATITIDGAGVFPNFSDRVTIKGRGNSTWSYPKKPYRLKFASSKKPFGLTKGKSWVLLANYQRGSMMTNAIAMKLARMVGTPAANQIIPVELYLNGKYVGSYNFTQQVGLSNNSIDADDTTAALFELDTYYDEDYKFRSDPYTLPVNIKDPDLSEEPNDTHFNVIRDGFNNFASLVKSGTDEYTTVMDADYFARFLLVNDVVYNRELQHPKSTYLHRYNIYDASSKYIWGPVWDFDWAFGYEGGSVYYMSDPDADLLPRIHTFFGDMYRNSEQVRRAYSKEWTDFMRQHRDELIEYVADYYDYARPSLEHDATVWPGVAVDYAVSADNARLWLSQRTKSVYDKLEKYPQPTPGRFVEGDANMDDRVSLGDVVAISNNIAGRVNPVFDFDRADIDVNHAINMTDVALLDTIILNTPITADYLAALDEGDGIFSMDDFELVEQKKALRTLTFSTGTNEYVALQFDLRHPRNLKLGNILKPTTMSSFYLTTLTSADSTETRLLLTPSGGSSIPRGKHLFRLNVNAESVIPAADCRIEVTNAVAATTASTEYRMEGTEASFGITPVGIHTPESLLASSVVVEGGEALILHSSAAGTLPVYAADGRVVRTVSFGVGTTRIALAPGIYVVAGQKAVVR